MADKAKNVVLNFKMDGQVQYAKTLKDINMVMNTAAKEYKNHIAAMGSDASATDKLRAEKKKLEIQMEGAQKRTKMLRDEFDAMSKNTKTTSEELNKMYGKVLAAENAEISLQKSLERVNDGLSEQSEESRKNQDALNKLQQESAELESQTDKLNSEFELQKSALGENATEAEKAALAHEHLGKKSELVEKQIANMEDQLKLVKAEFGENSIEANKMETELNEAKTAFNNLGREMDGMKSASDNAAEGMDGFTKVLSSAVLMEIADRLSAISDKIFDIGQTSIEAAATMRASNAQFEQVFGEMEEQAQSTVEKLGESFGILPNRLKPTYSAISSQLMSLGIDQQKAMELAADSTTAAADAAAFYDLSLEDAASRVQSFLKGNLSAAEGIGIFANASGLATYAISNGFVEATEEQEQFAKKMELSIEGAQRNAEKAIKKYGENSFEARNATQKLNEELDKQEKGLDLTNKWNELSEAQKQAVRVDYITHMQEQAKVTGQASREMDGYENIIGNTKSAMEEFQSAIGEPALEMFSDVLQKAIPMIQGFAEWFSNLNPAIKQFIVIFAGVIAVVGAVLPILATGFAAIAAAAALAGVTIGAFITTTLLPIIAIVAGVILAITGLILLIKNWGAVTDWLKEKFGQFGIDLDGVFQKIKSVIETVVQAVSDFTMSIWGELVSWWNENNELIMKTVDTVWNAIKTIIDNVLKIIIPIIELAWTSIKATTQVVWELIKGLVQTALKAILGVIKAIMQLITGDWRGAWETIKSTIGEVLKGIIQTVVNTLNAILGNVTSIFGAVKKVVTNTWDTIQSTITKSINMAKDAVKVAIEAIKGFFNFKWKLPEIKMPKFSVKGSANPLKWLEEGVPKLEVKWNAKGGIFTQPTIFGMSGGRLQGAGEAGPEAVLPLNEKTLGEIGKGIAANMDGTGGDITVHVYLDTDEVTTKLAPGMSKKLNDNNKIKARSQGVVIL